MIESLQSTVQKCWSLLHEKFNLSETHPAPSIVINKRLRTTGGRAQIRRPIVEISPYLLQSDAPTDTIVAHEVAHIFNRIMLGGKGHDKKWQECMIRMGLPPDRCHRYAGVKRNQQTTARCPGCNHEHHMSTNRLTRMKRGQRYVCLECQYVMGIVYKSDTLKPYLAAYHPQTKDVKVGDCVLC